MRGLDAPEGAVRAGAYSALAEAAAADPSLSGPVARLLAWSDILEQSAMIDAEGRVTADQAAGVDGLRRALARLRSVDPTAGPAAARDVQNRELHRRLDVQQRAVSTHTAYRPLQIDSALRLSEAGWVPWLSLATPLYDGRPGGGRRFGLSPGMAVTVLDGELQVAVDRLGWLRGRFNLLQASHVNLARRGPPLGWHLDLADLRYAREGQRRSEARWAETGGLLGLLQSDDMRNHLVLYAGVAARSWTRTQPASGLSALWVPAERLGQGVGLGLPVGLRGQLQAAGRPLSNLRLDATWTPVLDLQARWHPEASGQLQGQLRLGRMGRWDGALRLSAAGRVQELGLSKGVPSFRNPELELRAGLYFERW